MFAKSLAELKLDSHGKIGYTYKCLGAGFWAFRQTDFREALTDLVMEVKWVSVRSNITRILS